ASHDRQALGVVTDGVFHGHADAAVHLNRFLTDVAGGPVDDDLRGDDVAMTVLLRADGFGSHGQARIHGHAAGIFEFGVEVGGTVLQCLIHADGGTELL